MRARAPHAFASERIELTIAPRARAADQYSERLTRDWNEKYEFHECMEKCKTLIEFEAPFQAIESTATNPVSRQTANQGSHTKRAPRGLRRGFSRAAP